MRLIEKIANAFQQKEESWYKRNLRSLFKTLNVRNIELHLAGSKKRNLIAIEH